MSWRFLSPDLRLLSSHNICSGPWTVSKGLSELFALTVRQRQSVYHPDVEMFAEVAWMSWDISYTQPPFNSMCHPSCVIIPASVSCLSPCSADGNYLLSCGSDKSLKLWSVSRGTLLKTYSGHGYEVLDADGWEIVSGKVNSTISDVVILWEESDKERKINDMLKRSLLPARSNCVCLSLTVLTVPMTTASFVPAALIRQ